MSALSPQGCFYYVQVSDDGMTCQGPETGDNGKKLIMLLESRNFE